MKELWSVKDGIAKEHDYNIDSFVAVLKSRELAAGPGLISRHAEKESELAKCKQSFNGETAKKARQVALRRALVEGEESGPAAYSLQGIMDALDQEERQ